MNRLPRDLIEVAFSFISRRSTQEACVIDFLKKFGFARHELVQTREGRWHQVRVYLRTPRQVRKLARAFQAQSLAGVRFSNRPLAYAAWAEKWKEDYQIQNLGRRFLIVPAWRLAELKKIKLSKRIPIVIDPQSAFGSGEHETTRLIVRLMEECRGRFSSFLDLGTGTGILSIAAVHCGAREVVGLDNDKPSVACAIYNFKKNNLGSQSARFFFQELAQFRTSKKFDLVCANINSHILEKYRRQIVHAAPSGGYVLVSGIIHQTFKSFRSEFDGKDLRCMKILRGRRWVSILYKKS